VLVCHAFSDMYNTSKIINIAQLKLTNRKGLDPDSGRIADVGIVVSIAGSTSRLRGYILIRIRGPYTETINLC
jgi:hypothetical protein